MSGEGVQGAGGVVWINFHRYHLQWEFVFHQGNEETLELDKEKRGDICLKKASMIAEVSRQIGWT